MNKMDARRRFLDYLKTHSIQYKEDIDGGACRLSMLYEGYEKCPDKIIESCVWFYESVMEARIYFDHNTAEWCRESKHRSELMRLLNFCNARIWPCTVDGMNSGLYMPNYLHTPRFYITEDDSYDITMTNMIPYDFYEIAPLETEDFLTAACPNLLNDLSVPIFLVLLGKISAEQAISDVKKNILGEE